MNPSTTRTSGKEGVLALELSAILAARSGHSDAVTHVDSEPLGTSSWYGAERVTAHFGSGQKMTIFLKDFGSSEGHRARHGATSLTAAINRNDLAARRERELGAYRDLIGRSDLGSPAYIGNVWKPAEEQYWLLLEFVTGEILQLQSDLTAWVDAAGWLGKLQGYVASTMDYLTDAPYLIRHDQSYLQGRAHDAMRDVSLITPAEAGRLERILERFPAMITLMQSLPPTLVHGNYLPRNILVSQRDGKRRICPVDWEEAAIGSPLYDLAFLSDGFTPPLLDHMLDRYRLEAALAGVALPDRNRMIGIIDAIRLYRLILFLSRSVEKRFPAASVIRLLGKAEALAAQWHESASGE